MASLQCLTKTDIGQRLIRTSEIADILGVQDCRGSSVFLRGTGVQGADALIDGVKWEIKTIESATDTAVFNRIRKAVKGQSDRVIIDGSAVGLTPKIFEEGYKRALRNGKIPSEVIVLYPGEILERWVL